MRSADKVTLVNTVHGAHLDTFAASRTNFVINNREVIHDLNSSVRAGLLTLHTADTTVAALLTGDSALLVI